MNTPVTSSSGHDAAGTMACSAPHQFSAASIAWKATTSPTAADLAAHPEQYYYVAMRFNYAPNSKTWWRDARLLMIGPISNEMARNMIAEGLGLPRSF